MLNREQKKEWAKLLYLKEQFSQKEIAEKVGITEKTMSKWVNSERWEVLKASIIVTKEESLRRLYAQLNEINTAIEKKPEGERYAIGKEADAISKLAAAARSMETDVSIAEIMEVSKRILNWIRTINLNQAKDFASLIDGYIKTLL